MKDLKRLLILTVLSTVLFSVIPAPFGIAEQPSLLKSLDNNIFQSEYSWKTRVWTTTFYIGQGALANVPGSSCNRSSAWDRNWVDNYGGIDYPNKRIGYRPANFIPKQNPFYIALPFNDLAYPTLAKQWIPWINQNHGKSKSLLKGQWLAIHHKGRVCFAQWEDVGPWNTSAASYVFGKARYSGKAGLDISPAVRDYLRLPDSDYSDWRFVDLLEVPLGPWLEIGTARNDQKNLLTKINGESQKQVKLSQKFWNSIKANTES